MEVVSELLVYGGVQTESAEGLVHSLCVCVCVWNDTQADDV